MNDLRLLLVTEDEGEGRPLLDLLQSDGSRVACATAGSSAALHSAMADGRADVVVASHPGPVDVVAALAIVREHDAAAPFIVCSGALGPAAPPAGVQEYVPAGDPAVLAEAVRRALRAARERRAAGPAAARADLLAAIVESSDDAIVGMDPDGVITSWNPAARRMCGYAAPDILGARFERLFPREQRGDAARLLDLARAGAGVAQHESVWRDRTGGRFPVSLTVSAVGDPKDGASIGLSAIARDISDRRRFEEQLRFLADHDPLTGLLNRRRLEQELDRLHALARRYGEPLALLVLDLDQFKYHNDTLGHGAGDDLIRAVARVLRLRLRETDVLARLGGDEFAVVLPRTGLDDAAGVAAQLLVAVRGVEIVRGGRVARTTASIGMAMLEDDGAGGADLLARADLAMYEAKDRGRDRAVASTPRDHLRLRSRIGWEQRIRQALAEDLFCLHAQPIVDLATGRVTQHELLLRMGDGKGDLVPPRAFLGVAERTGLINDVDRWVAREAIRIAATAGWANHGRKLEVNLSGRSIDDPDLPGMIESEIERHRVDPRRLVFEITETAAIANMDEAVRFARRLNAAGCGFALDDFGTGFGSFYYLKHLPLDYLKIDGDFIRELPRVPTDQVMVEAIQQVARGLGLKTIAEFVGDAETVALLRGYGVDLGQGYHLGRPAEIPAEAARAAG